MNTSAPRIGYIGVDVLNNATVCNEATAMLAAGAPLEVVSVYPYQGATFHHDASLAALRAAVTNLFPLSRWELARALAAGPFWFGRRFWTALANAATGPAEGPKQRLTILYQFLPALILATRWRSRRIGHIHAHWAHTATAVALHAAELLGVGFSFTGHANDLFVHRVGLIAKVRRARFMICISEFHRRFYLALGADPARLPVVYCGIDAARHGPAATVIDETGPPRVVAVGRLVEKKGFHDLIAACALLRDDGVSFTCMIAGSGPEYARLAALVAEHRLEGVVTLTNRTVLQEELPALLQSSRVMALPCVRDRQGDMDGLPQVLIEALLCGIPVVSTRLVGIPDLVRHAETGLLVEPGDVRALAAAVGMLLASPALTSQLGGRGRDWALAHFTVDETVRRLSALFAAAASTPGHAALELAMPAAGEQNDPTAPPPRARPSPTIGERLGLIPSQA